MIRSLLAPLAAFALTSCFIQPGAFESALTLNRDGTFDYRYSGEVVALNAALLDGMTGTPMDGGADVDFDAAAAVCSGDAGDRYVAVNGSDEDGIASDDMMIADDATDVDGPDAVADAPCTAEEIEGERQRRRDRNLRRDRENAQRLAMMKRMGGLGDGSEEAYREVARRLNEQRGWSNVTYQGKGVFTGSYRITGRVDAGFVFPLLPTTETITPFVRLVPMTGGRVRVDAPGLTTAASFYDQLEPMASLMGEDTGSTGGLEDVPRPRGTFTLTTDAEVLTNNTVDGPVAAGRSRRMSWTVGGLQQVVPEALLRL